MTTGKEQGTVRNELRTPSRDEILGDTGVSQKVALALAKQLLDSWLGPITALRRVTDLGVLSGTVHRSVAHVQDISAFCDGAPPDPRTTAGSGFDETTAELGALGEAIERYCLAAYDSVGFRDEPVETRDTRTLSPATFDKQHPSDREANTDLTTDRLRWTLGTSLRTGEQTFLPAAFVYLPFDPLPQRPPTSTGAATGTGYADACLRAVCEIIEREAVAVSFYNEVSLPRLDRTTLPPRVRQVVERFETASQRVHLLDATFDAPFPTVLALITDEERRPAVCLGANCAPDGDQAVEGAVLEAFQTRRYAREVDQDATHTERPITTLADRAAFWAEPGRLDDIACWTTTDEVVPTPEGWQRNPADDRPFETAALSAFIDYLVATNLECLIVDITTADIAEEGFRVVKAVGVEFHPLSLDERRPMRGGDRLYRLPVTHGPLDGPKTYADLKRIPHPFV